MNITLTRAALSGAGFLLIFVLGYTLSRAGKPYPGLLFNLHKLIALAVLVLLVYTAARAHQAAPLGPLPVALTALAVLFFVATIATGGLVSTAKTIQPAPLLHRLLPYLTLIASGAAWWMLVGGR